MINTIKSILRVHISVVGKYSPIKTKDRSIEDIVNHIRYKHNFSSSGQPTKRQFSLIQQAGYDVIINLAPYDIIEYPLKDEAAIVTRLGMEYVHIPVKMLNPTQENFETFVNTIKNAPDKKIWVHCAVGMRATAFLYRYRCAILGEDRQTAIWELREIWEPFGAWKQFVFGENDAPI